jgi:uncharacterized protein YybS (DUF2232 family)
VGDTGAAGKRRVVGAGVEIVLATLLTVGLFASGSVFPVLGIGLSLLSPLPLVALGLRHGRPALLGATLLAAGCLAIPLSWRYAVMFAVEFGTPAILLAEGLRRGARSERLVGGAACAPALGGLIVLMVAAGSADPRVAVARHVDGLLLDVETLTARMGLPTEGVPQAETSVERIRPLLLAGFPGFFFVGSLLSAAGYVLFLQAGLRRWSRQLGGAVAGPFRWELPELLVWAVIASGGCLLAGTEPWRSLGLNGLIILLALYFLQGLNIAAFLFRRFQLPRFLATLSVVLLVFQPFFTLLVAGLGLFDVWFGFRQLTIPKTPHQT